MSTDTEDEATLEPTLSVQPWPCSFETNGHHWRGIGVQSPVSKGSGRDGDLHPPSQQYRMSMWQNLSLLQECKKAHQMYSNYKTGQVEFGSEVVRLHPLIQWNEVWQRGKSCARFVWDPNPYTHVGQAACILLVLMPKRPVGIALRASATKSQPLRPCSPKASKISTSSAMVILQRTKIMYESALERPEIHGTSQVKVASKKASKSSWLTHQSPKNDKSPTACVD